MNKYYYNLLEEENLLKRVKLENLILVDSGLRPCSQTTVPVDLPNGREMGSRIDEQIRPMIVKIRGIRNPREKLKAINKTKKMMERAFEKVVRGSEEYRSLEKKSNQLNLKTKKVKIRPTVEELYLYRDRSTGREIEKLMKERGELKREARRRPDPSKGRLQLVYPEEFNGEWLKRMGALLGYPDCCAEAYASDRENGVNVEERAASQIERHGGDGDLDTHAYFVAYFFPCQPECDGALEKGYRIHENLKGLDEKLGELYEDALRKNMNLVKEQPNLIANYVSQTER